MGGGLLELVARGGQDVYLICNPQVSFFKKVYKRHTNFSIDFQKHTFKEEPKFGKKLKFTVPRNADLLKNVTLQFQLPDLVEVGTNTNRYVNYIGYSFIDYIEIFIGGTSIEKLTGEYLYIHNELHLNHEKRLIYDHLVGGVRPIKSYPNFDTKNKNNAGTYYVPISFWFTKDTALSLPMVALQYHDIEIVLSIRKFDDLWVSNQGNIPTVIPTITNCSLHLEYIYLDKTERKLFAQSNHEYLIKQVQYFTSNTILANQTNVNLALPFNHPLLELIFIVQNRSSFTNTTISYEGNRYLYFSKKQVDNNDPDVLFGEEPIKSAKILLNNEDRTIELSNKELRFLTTLHSHTNSAVNNFIYSYSFSMNPESFQPTGSCNFSRFDSKELSIEFEDELETCNVKVFAVNYNVLRISMGLGGLAYIN